MNFDRGSNDFRCKVGIPQLEILKRKVRNVNRKVRKEHAAIPFRGYLGEYLHLAFCAVSFIALD